MIKLKSLIVEIHHDEIYLYHGTNVNAGYHIQKSGKMKLNSADNNEPFLSFSEKLNVARYYKLMKGGEDRGIILRVKKTDDFKLSDKYKKNDGYEWVTTREIPSKELEIFITKYGWIQLTKWDFIDKRII